jgi:hypothetical protein
MHSFESRRPRLLDVLFDHQQKIQRRQKFLGGPLKISKCPQFASSPVSYCFYDLRDIPDLFTMAEHVHRTWNTIKEIPNYELIAGELLFRR